MFTRDARPSIKVVVEKYKNLLNPNEEIAPLNHEEDIVARDEPNAKQLASALQGIATACRVP